MEGSGKKRDAMPIAITPEHKDLADSVRALVERVAPPEVLHAALDEGGASPDNFPPYWRAAAEQGLHGVHLAESAGGQGFGILELAVVIAEFGRGAVPGPFVPSAISSALRHGRCHLPRRPRCWCCRWPVWTRRPAAPCGW